MSEYYTSEFNGSEIDEQISYVKRYLKPKIVEIENELNKKIISEKIADGAVETSKVADGAVTAAKLADGAVSEEKFDTDLSASFEGKENKSEKGQANGYAPLDESGKVADEYLYFEAERNRFNPLYCNALKGSREGTNITISDAVEGTPVSLSLYGTLTEAITDLDSKKSPDNPATLTGIGESGSVTVTITDGEESEKAIELSGFNDGVDANNLIDGSIDYNLITTVWSNYGDSYATIMFDLGEEMYVTQADVWTLCSAIQQVDDITVSGGADKDSLTSLGTKTADLTGVTQGNKYRITATFTAAKVKVVEIKLHKKTGGNMSIGQAGLLGYAVPTTQATTVGVLTDNAAGLGDYATYKRIHTGASIDVSVSKPLYDLGTSYDGTTHRDKITPEGIEIQCKRVALDTLVFSRETLSSEGEYAVGCTNFFSARLDTAHAGINAMKHASTFHVTHFKGYRYHKNPNRDTDNIWAEVTYGGDGRFRIWVRDSFLNLTDTDTDEEKIAKLMNWLTEQKDSGTPVEMIYALETPQFESNETGSKFTALSTSSTITNDEGAEMGVEYHRDINKALEEIGNAMITLGGMI